MGIKDFMGMVKRLTGYGSPSVLDDTPTLDLLDGINVYRKRIWGFADWKWALEPLSFAITTGTNQFTVSAAAGSSTLVDRIVNLIPQDPNATPAVMGSPLKQRTIDDFYRWCAPDIQRTAIPTDYINVGQDANGKWKIIVSPYPSQAFTMAGYAKKILTTYTLADVLANTSFGYFPDGVIETELLDGVRSVAYSCQGQKELALTYENRVEARLKSLANEQLGVATDNGPLPAPVPDSYTWRKRMRKGTTRV